jgi:hypothetical protein
VKPFKDLGIAKPQLQNFIGEKISIYRILNREIAVLDFKIEPSKYEGECLTLQIVVGQTKHVIFTSAQCLLDVIKQLPPDGLPFTTTIIEEDNKVLQLT